MGIECVLAAPFAAGHADREFVQRCRNGTAETHIGAETLYQVAQHRAAQQRIKRSSQAGSTRPDWMASTTARCSSVICSAVSGGKRVSDMLDFFPLGAGSNAGNVPYRGSIDRHRQVVG